jgi:hypothetical protein
MENSKSELYKYNSKIKWHIVKKENANAVDFTEVGDRSYSLLEEAEDAWVALLNSGYAVDSGEVLIIGLDS